MFTPEVQTAQARLRFVVDPVWRVLHEDGFRSAWATLRQEAQSCGFVGLDLEWTTVEVEPEESACETSDSSKTAAPPRAANRKKPKRYSGPVATVQLSTSTISFVFRYCDLWHLAKGPNDKESGWRGDPYAPSSAAWPNHRVGERANRREMLVSALQALHDFLQDDHIVKVGVGIGGDMTKYQRDYPSQTIQPCVDLVTLANHYIHRPITLRLPGDAAAVARSGGTSGDAHGARIEVCVAEVQSLREMSVVFCGRTLAKDLRVVMSDWGGSLGALSPMQIEYAAKDAEASFDACVGILKAGFTESADSGKKGPPTNWLTLLKPLETVLAGHADRTTSQGENAALGRKDPPKPLAQRLRAHQSDETSYDADEAVDVGWCKGRTKPYYDNIDVYDANMNLVFTVDQSKAEWYVHKKQIAHVIEWRDADPATLERQPNGRAAECSRDGRQERQMAAIKLSFVPDFRKFNDAHIRRNLEYFQQPKANVCVVCGTGDALVRFAVVPMMYRKYFPSVYMSHNSYDLLLLCTACFAKSRGVYEAERQCVSKDFGIPLAHLTPARLAAFEREIAAAEEALCKEAGQQRDGRGSSKEEGEEEEGDDLVAHHLSETLRLAVMKEFCEVERHHDCLVTILKYAKALHGHYVTAGVDTGKSLVGDRRFRIPEDKVALMCDYVDRHAPRYYFHQGDPSGSRVTSPAVVGLPSSPEGVRWILVGDGGDAGDRANTSDSDEASENRSLGSARLRATLTDFWFRENPHLIACIPRTVRAEEKAETPLVDSHGFFVVRMLMEKYANHPSKNGEHAVGQFIYRWRRAFLDRMQPKHLPSGWLAEDGILR